MMISTESIEFNYYSHELKDNYRKGIHRLRAILATPVMADKFANNMAAVSVVFGSPVGSDDKNSVELRKMLTESDVGHIAVNSFLNANGYQAYPTLDDKFSDHARCTAIAADPIMYRSLTNNNIAIGKLIAGLARLTVSTFASMDTVAASATAINAVFANPAALNAMIANPVALTAVGKSDIAICKYICHCAGLPIANYGNMAAVAASAVAMDAVCANYVAMNAAATSSVAMKAIGDSNIAIGKFVCSKAGISSKSYANLDILLNSTNGDYNKLAASTGAMSTMNASNVGIAKYISRDAGLKSTDYADMDALVTNTTLRNNTQAMNLINKNSIAIAKLLCNIAGLTTTDYDDMNAVIASTTAIDAVFANSTAVGVMINSSVAMNAIANNAIVMQKAASTVSIMNAIVANSFAMLEVGSSRLAMSIVAKLENAVKAIEASTVATDRLFSSPLRTYLTNISANFPDTKPQIHRENGPLWLISAWVTPYSGISQLNVSSTITNNSNIYHSPSVTNGPGRNEATGRVNRFMHHLHGSLSYSYQATDNKATFNYLFIPCEE